MNSKEIFHLWANQSRPSAKSGNVFFDGPTCYSYGHHFPIGTLKTLDDSTRIALLNPNGYSVSTTRHKSYARQAIHGREVHYITPSRWFQITTREELDSAIARQAEADAASADAVKAQKREAAKANRERKKLEKIDWQELAAKWRAGEPIPNYVTRNKPVILRLANDGKHIETSHGATVPARAAVIAWGVIQGGKGDPEFSWGNYRGLEISPDEIRVGCHAIPMAEIKLMAETLQIA